MPINKWPSEDRPREKLIKHGEHSLSDSELLAILLRTGVQGASAIDLARRVLEKFGTFRDMSHTDSRDWKEFKGLGTAKMAQIKAALEIGRRFHEQERGSRTKVKNSKDVADLFMGRMRDLKNELFHVLLLNTRNSVIDKTEIADGTVTQANPVIREIFSYALQKFAASLVCVHNHPSGDPHPSQEDRHFTRQLCQAGKLMQITVLDHIIIGDNTYYSFADSGELEK